MRAKRKIITLFSIAAFLFSLTAVYGCSSDKRRASRVHSKSGMGNAKHKNKHVWGK